MGGIEAGPGESRNRRTRSSRPSARIVEAPTVDDDTLWSADEWSDFLTERFGLPVQVTYGHSRTAPVQARAFQATPSQSGWALRLHRMFAEAPEAVRDALAVWLRVGRRARRAGPVLDEWIHETVASLPPLPRRVRLEAKGEVHDLEALVAPLLRGEFSSDFESTANNEPPSITWGRRVRSRSRRSLRLGSFEPESRVVRIHPVLDQEAVPEWFVRFVLKHEILHSIIDTYRDASGRWVHHGPEFRKRESRWPEYDAAVRWERRNLARLIRSAREGTTLRVRAEDLAVPAELAEVRPPHGAAKQQLLPF